MDHYPAVARVKGIYVGQVRSLFQGLLINCTHEHKTQSAAETCARKLFAAFKDK